jgi:hypothetical protein
MIHIMLPVQYARQAGAHRIEPQRRLMLAVLQTVVDDFKRTRDRLAAGVHSARDRRAYEQAMAYLASTDRTWPFSFENICEAIGLDAHGLRTELDGTAPPK